MDKLLDFLATMGIKVEDGKFHSLVLKDAIINIYRDEQGRGRVDVNPVDSLTLATAETLDNFFDDFESEPNEMYDEDLDWLDDALEEFIGNCEFNIEDKVIVKGYEGRIFEVGGIGLSDSEGLCYDLVDEEGDIITAFEEDMTLYKQQTQAKQLVGGFLKGIVDELLDKYNDYKLLYKTFGDVEYKQEMDDIMAEIKKIKL